MFFLCSFGLLPSDPCPAPSPLPTSHARSSVACSRYDRAGRLSVARLTRKHGPPAGLPSLRHDRGRLPTPGGGVSVRPVCVCSIHSLWRCSGRIVPRLRLAEPAPSSPSRRPVIAVTPPSCRRLWGAYGPMHPWCFWQRLAKDHGPVTSFIRCQGPRLQPQFSASRLNRAFFLVARNSLGELHELGC
jgi:hypothetical protein